MSNTCGVCNTTWELSEDQYKEIKEGKVLEITCPNKCITFTIWAEKEGEGYNTITKFSHFRKQEFHWGKWVDSEDAITGVIQNNNVEFLSEDIYKGIDLDYEKYVKEHPDEEDIDWESDNDTYIIGSWKKGEDGKYEPDKENGEYAAIVDEIYTQVVWSKFTKRCNLCSPCYPGQGDLDSEGIYLTYTLPPDLIGFTDK
jgi:hypothetical protein